MSGYNNNNEAYGTSSGGLGVCLILQSFDPFIEVADRSTVQPNLWRDHQQQLQLRRTP
jgi:hypothetical protein